MNPIKLNNLSSPDLYTKMAYDLDTDYDLIRAVVESQFKLARERCKEGSKDVPGSFKNIRFMHLGMLAVKTKSINDARKEIDNI